MDYLKAKEIMAFLLACGIQADFENDGETRIEVYSDKNDFLFFIDDEENWEALKAIAGKIVVGLQNQ